MTKTQPSDDVLTMAERWRREGRGWRYREGHWH